MSASEPQPSAAEARGAQTSATFRIHPRQPAKYIANGHAVESGNDDDDYVALLHGSYRSLTFLKTGNGFWRIGLTLLPFRLEGLLLTAVLTRADRVFLDDDLAAGVIHLLIQSLSHTFCNGQ